MTATITPAVESTTTSQSSKSAKSSLWRAGARAGLAASAATVAVAAVAHAAGVSFETAPGEAIPLFAFAQLTLVCTVVGVLIARTLNRRASQPRRTFVRTTVVLTAASLIPDLLISAGAATKASLIVTHVVAAAIVIPALSSRLAECRA